MYTYFDVIMAMPEDYRDLALSSIGSGMSIKSSVQGALDMMRIFDPDQYTTLKQRFEVITDDTTKHTL